jgi:uncharacterized Zn-finger protein
MSKVSGEHSSRRQDCYSCSSDRLPILPPNTAYYKLTILELIITNNADMSASFCLSKIDKTRPYICGTCQRSFARLEYLQRYKRCHIKEKPFEYPTCLRYARRDLLLHHQKKLHHMPTTSSYAGIYHDSTSGVSGVASGRNRARKLSVAGLNPTASNTQAIYTRLRTNAITYVNGNTM